MLPCRFVSFRKRETRNTSLRCPGLLFGAIPNHYAKREHRRRGSTMKTTVIVRGVLVALLLSAAAIVSAQLADLKRPAGSDHSPVLLWQGGAPGSQEKTGEEAVRVTPDGEH